MGSAKQEMFLAVCEACLGTFYEKPLHSFMRFMQFGLTSRGNHRSCRGAQDLQPQQDTDDSQVALNVEGVEVPWESVVGSPHAITIPPDEAHTQRTW